MSEMTIKRGVNLQLFVNRETISGLTPLLQFNTMLVVTKIGVLRSNFYLPIFWGVSPQNLRSKNNKNKYKGA